jgi:hypothetical protein
MRARADSVIYDKSVSLLGHQHTLFQDKALIIYYLLQMLNFRIYMNNTHLFQEVKDNFQRDNASISAQKHQEIDYFV